MRFSLIDRITDLQPGVRIETVKCLSLAEEYLADHFPRAPVMPGVMMLEALTQSCAWLVRASEDFVHSVVLLKEARSVKYASFVEPGMLLRITAEIQSQDERFTKFKAQGMIDDAVAVSARLTIERYNLAEELPNGAVTDRYVTARMRELFDLLYRGQPTPA
jgi:3-hydroxyacyl-[acyl-carrier-protein] dehydratase